MEKYNVFLSYQSHEKELVNGVYIDLTKKGYSVWFDKVELYDGIGAVLSDKLAAGIKKSDLIVLFINQKYIESQNCQLEYRFAKSLNKPPLFMLLEKDLKLPDDLEFYMADKIRYDYFKDQNLNRLYESIDRRLVVPRKVSSDLKLHKPACVSINEALDQGNTEEFIRHFGNGQSEALCRFYFLKACKLGHRNIVEHLLSKFVEINVTDDDGSTGLILASEKGHLYVVYIFIFKNANLNIADNDGWTALHWASFKGHIEIVRTLLEKGANAYIETKKKEIAVQLAHLGRHQNIINLLQNY